MRKLLLFLLFIVLANNAFAACGDGTTTNLSLCLPSDGDTSWGTNIRDNFTTLDTALGATFITKTANGTLDNEQALSSLSSGLMRVATTTGAITSITDSAGIASNISDETGTGALVLADSPTLTTTATITGSSASMVVDSSGGATIAADRGSASLPNSAVLSFRTAGTSYFTLGLDGVLHNGSNAFVSLKDSSGNELWSIEDAGTTGHVIVTGNLTATGGTSTLATLAGALDAGGATSFEIPNGTGPTVNATGELALDTTNDQLILYGSSATRVYAYTGSKDKTIEDPVDADDNIPLMSWPYAVTVTKVYCNTTGSSTPSISMTLGDGTNSFEAITCDDDGATDDGSITNATFNADEQLEVDFGAPSGTVDWVTLRVDYTVNAT